MQIQAQDAVGKEIKSEETIDLEFLSSSLAGEFLNASSSPASTIMRKGTANRIFYYRDSNAGTFTLTVKARGRDSGTLWTASQTITVSNPSVPGSAPAPAPSPSGQSAGVVPTLPASPAAVPAIFSNSQIHADAGPDQTAAVGSLVEFKGTALGLKKEPLTTARFWWNFGDGETQEGNATDHIFRMPGTYIVGLHVSAGEYSSSDYATIRVLENKIRVSGVMSGGEGYVRFANGLNAEVDIGDWIIEDESHKQFFVPPKTKIAAGGDISFSNSITGLLAGKEPYSLVIQYPNGTVALTYAVPPDSVEVLAASSPTTTILGIPAAHLAAAPDSSLKNAAVRMKKPSPGDPNAGAAASRQDMPGAHGNAAVLAPGFSVSSRMMLAGAIGFSALGALGFFVLKQFLM